MATSWRAPRLQHVNCESVFGPTGAGWAAHRDWQACPGAGGDDHPHIIQFLHEGPHMYLDVGLGSSGGPLDDF